MIDLISSKFSKQSERPIQIHTTFWILFIAYELLVVYYHIGSLERPLVYIVFYTINIAFFYACLNLLNYTLEGEKVNYLVSIAKYFALLFFFLTIKAIADQLLGKPEPALNDPYIYIRQFLPRNLARAVYFTLLAIFYCSAKYVTEYKRKASEAEKRQLIIEKENAKLETQLTKSQNAYLQQQINPHMLFNALNFVYNSTQQYSEDAAHCIWLLSEIMRFSLEEAGPDGKINLSREIEQIENLIAINRYRFKEPLYISVEIGNDLDDHQIIPLILLTLTENIFKHGNLTDPNSAASLKLFTDDSGKLTFQSLNLKKSKNGHTRQRKALGLQNIRLRLDSFYRDNYTLQINEAGEFYELTLTLQL
ncbi:Histidine kinase [Pedobacter suwonensis]|uniref:Histidine kinase n=1 Tax=Pedobacter suwonensis TaxID=332999 RepID=A0A1I0SR93_9SPHI|nr:histidine kinase [Pedobacter suwonensis]SFA41276.1 Histidine kinase [Pedobacter suwonensis]